MKKTLRKIIFGTTLPQEYLCINLNEFTNPLKMIIRNDSGIENDITHHHLFNGYNPLVITIDGNYLSDKELNNQKSVCITFQNNEKKILASLNLKLIKALNVDSFKLVIFEGVKGENLFLNPVHRIINNLYYKLVSDKKQNIYLEGNLYDQMKIAYSIPRKIFLVTVGSGNRFNIFPTDLSGIIGQNKFVISLRKGGKANQQIENEKKFVVSSMEANCFETVYKLGKNHMKELADINKLGIKFRNETSSVFGLPIPEGATKYFELECFDSYGIGIHNLHLCKVINYKRLSESNSELAHIHRDYAEWRIRNEIQTNYYFRK